MGMGAGRERNFHITPGHGHAITDVRGRCERARVGSCRGTRLYGLALRLVARGMRLEAADTAAGADRRVFSEGDKQEVVRNYKATGAFLQLLENEHKRRTKAEWGGQGATWRACAGQRTAESCWETEGGKWCGVAAP